LRIKGRVVNTLEFAGSVSGSDLTIRDPDKDPSLKKVRIRIQAFKNAYRDPDTAKISGFGSDLTKKFKYYYKLENSADPG
jgi:hypothetical protein